MPMRCVSGSSSISRIRSMQYWRRSFPRAPRCERPRTSVESLSGFQPGGLAHGPDEKKGRAGSGGLVVVTINSPRREHAPRWDGVARRRFYRPRRIAQRESRLRSMLRCTTICFSSNIDQFGSGETIHRAEPTARPASRNLRLNLFTIPAHTFGRRRGKVRQVGERGAPTRIGKKRSPGGGCDRSGTQ